MLQRDILFLASERPRRVRHRKRGFNYVVEGNGELQSSAGPITLEEGDHLTVYRAEDGKLWLRVPGEFEDGRFEPA